jgi:hypothetical protein
MGDYVIDYCFPMMVVPDEGTVAVPGPDVVIFILNNFTVMPADSMVHVHPTGLEPAITRSVIWRIIHCATGAWLGPDWPGG